MSRRVLVTGSSRGIGKAIAEKLAGDGFDIVVHYKKNADKAAQTLEAVKSHGVAGAILQFDVSDREACRRLITEDIEQHGPYYGIVCNAGITADRPFPALSEEDWDSVVRTNLDSFYNVLHPVVMPMVEAGRNGRIVTIASLSGIVGNRGQVNYSAAKAGVIGATKALSKELAKRGITVNCVAPGLIETDIIKDIPVADAIKTIPMRRLGKPEEVASLVGFLFSDDAGYITGQVISINGGIA